MKRCTYCGRENENATPNCSGCGLPLNAESAPTPRNSPSFSLFPHSPEEWTRSLAYPLLFACILLLVSAFGEGFSQDRIWRYAGVSICGVLLPCLGFSLVLILGYGTGLSRGFRNFALVVAILSLLGFLLAPALAE